MKLTEQQVQFFKTFGYLRFPGMFSTEEITEIAKQFEHTMDNIATLHKLSGMVGGVQMGSPIEHTPHMCALLDDQRIKGIIGGVIGDDFNYCSGDGLTSG